MAICNIASSHRFDAYLITPVVRLLIQSFRNISVDLFDSELNLDIRRKIEDEWKEKVSNTIQNYEPSGDKRYVLSMFPYPSGNIHMGHVRVYTISDAISRYHRLNGRNVLQPIGWDAFGLPAENAARDRKISPSKWTKRNIADMRNQLKQLAFSFNWDREISTCDPRYYRWTQYWFLKLYKSGLVYRRQSLVNWDPVDETVLAEEQIDEKGCSWRSGSPVEKRLLNQWFIKTTRFAEKLYEGLSNDSLSDWKDIIDIQRNWIGECDGYNFSLKVSGLENILVDFWTDHPEMLPLASFVICAPGSLLDVVSSTVSSVDIPDVGCFRKLSHAIKNPFNGIEMPVFASKDVTFSLKRDTYLGVPSRSEFDYKLVLKLGLRDAENVTEMSREQVLKTAVENGYGGDFKVNSRLRDWLISRQRYWGTPIPMIHCDHCGKAYPVEESCLPVLLPPEDEVGKEEWLRCTCPDCGNPARRETDTMDTFVDSSWYFLRYLDPLNTEQPFDTELANEWMPVDIYVGGKEHATLHLYYARFMGQFLHSIGFLRNPEPLHRLLVQGMVMGQTFRDKSGRYLAAHQVKNQGDKVVTLIDGKGELVESSWEKMSKSKMNGIEPQAILNKYGIDATRLFLLFNVAPHSHRYWNEDLFADVMKWQHRLWLTVREFLKVRWDPLQGIQPWVNMEDEENKLQSARNKCVKGVNYHFESTHNLAAAVTSMQAATNPLRKCSREVRKYSKEYERTLATLIITLYPIMPHFASALWEGLASAPDRLNKNGEINWTGDVSHQKWPQIDMNYKMRLQCQVNKQTLHAVDITRAELIELNKEEAINLAMQHPKFNRAVRQFASDCNPICYDKDINRSIIVSLTIPHGTSIKDETEIPLPTLNSASA